MKDIYDILGEWRRSRCQPNRAAGSYVLATLVRVEGSSYRRPGARMLIWPDGKMIGSLSAGCLEAEVTLRAREVFETGEPAQISFETRRQFGCAGRYVGLIGPRKRRDQLMNDLLDREIAVKAGLFAPAVLDLGSETPEEIALAIVSEIQLVFADASGESLRERKIPIHANTPRSFQTFRLRAGQVPSRNPSPASNADTAGSFDSSLLRSG